MTREEIVKRIYELHEQVTKTDFGSFLISHVQLEAHLAKMDYATLTAALRFYEALNGSSEQ